MSFIIKKLLSAFFLPVPIALTLLILANFFFLFNYARMGKIFIFFSMLILLVFSTAFVPHLLLKHLESQYPPLVTVPSSIHNIVVLGGGNASDIHYPANSKLSAASLFRLIEGIRIHQMIPHSQLILSGGRIFGSPPESGTMNNVASMLGIPSKEIKIENGSQDTYHEAINLKKILKNKPFILVTSAYHMPRAMQIFQQEGMHPIAAPTELLLNQNQYTVKRYLPSANNLLYTDITLHEYFGIFWDKL